MVTCRDIITDAYRVGGIIALSENPESDEADFGMTGLQSMFQSWINVGLFGTMRDVYATADYTARENDRVTTADGAIVTIPDVLDSNADFYSYGDAPYGDYPSNGDRAPKQLSAISVVTAGVTTSYIYDRGRWVEIEALELGDDCPLEGFGRRGLAAALALELVAIPAFNSGPTPGMMQSARAFKSAVVANRYAAHNIIEPQFY